MRELPGDKREIAYRDAEDAVKALPSLEDYIARGGWKRFEAMSDEMRAVLRALADETDPDTDPGPDPDPVGGGDLDPYPAEWPKPGDDGRKVYEKVEVTARKPWRPVANADYVDMRVSNVDGGDRYALGEKLPDGIRFFNLVLDGCSGRHGIYWNRGHRETESDVRIYGGALDNCKFANGIEVKGSLLLIDGMEQLPNCKIGQTYRGRHGRKHTLVNCVGFGEIALRGWLHFVRNCKGARVKWWAGNLLARFEQWEAQHKKNGGFNMQRTELSYAEGVAAVTSGFLGQPDYPALNCIADPALRSAVKLVKQQGTRFQHIANPATLWKLAA